MVIGTMNLSIRNGQTEHIKPLPRCAKPSQRQSSQHSRSNAVTEASHTTATRVLAVALQSG